MTSVIAAAGTAGLSTPILAQPRLPRTPGQILGPFYPVGAKAAQTTDLTLVPGRGGKAEGQVLYVGGRVLNLAGEPVRNAEIEIWQANQNGRYTHPSDDNRLRSIPISKDLPFSRPTLTDGTDLRL